MSLQNVAVFAVLSSALAGPVLAGGLAEPAMEPPVTAPAQAFAKARPLQGWQGGYAGLSLGYGFQGDDRFGLHDSATDASLGNIGTLKGSGAEAGLRLGYRWQAGTWVFGPELGYTGTRVEDRVTGTAAAVEHTGKSSVEGLLALRWKTGVDLGDTLVYGTAGLGRAKVDYSLDGASGDFTTNAYVLGLGIERRLNDRWSLTGEYEYVGLGKTGRDFGALRTEATPSYHSLSVGLNFRF